MSQRSYRVLELDNSVLEEATVTDPLTGVNNRFALRREYIEYEGHDICVMMLDIDDFKHINDNYGHSVGDYVLKQTGNALITVFGKEGCYRYGGDEFLVIGEKTGKEEFSLLIEKLKNHLEEILIEEGSADRVNFSGGYVCGNARLNDDLRLMMSQADANLYKVKNTGKNRYIGTDYSRLAAERTDRNTVDILKLSAFPKSYEFQIFIAFFIFLKLILGSAAIIQINQTETFEKIQKERSI